MFMNSINKKYKFIVLEWLKASTSPKALKLATQYQKPITKKKQFWFSYTFLIPFTFFRMKNADN